jgi:hypothetical protein
MSSEEVAVNIVNGVAAHKRTLVMTSQGKLTVWINKLLPALADKLVFNHFTKEKNALIK